MDSSELEDKESGSEVALNVPSSVLSRIEELMGGTEQFDSAEFDAVSYINLVFPTAQSLSGAEAAEAAAALCAFRLAAAGGDVRRLLRAHSDQREEGHRALRDAQRTIADLATQVSSIKAAASQSEDTVRSITAEIKALDAAKAHLTAAITALNHYHMLLGGVDALADMTRRRQYREVALPLQALQEVLQHFASYSDIPEISSLRARVHATRKELGDQILADFKSALSPDPSSRVPLNKQMLSAACPLLDVLDPGFKEDLLRWLVDLQLQEYQHLFSPEQEYAWLSHIERRYAYLKKLLLAFEDGIGALFPAHWRLSERIAQEAAKMSRSQLCALLASRRAELDVKLLLFAIQKTNMLELLLHKRFVGTDLSPDAPPGTAGEGSEGGTGGDTDPLSSPSPWVGLISGCFEPYLELYITSLDGNLRALMDRFIQEAKAESSPSQPPPPSAPHGAVIASCADLFLFYKKCLVQCARLSTGEPMLELASVFQKYLREYCVSVLQAALPRGAGAGGAAAGAGGGLQLVTNLHTLLGDDSANARYSRDEVSQITRVVTTAEYCLETSLHLEHKLKEKVSPGLSPRVDLSPELDLFHKLISACIQLLVQDLETACEPALASMTKVSWLNYDTVGDQSSYVTHIVMHLRNVVPILRDNLASSRKYFTQFCIRFASSFIPKFIQNVYKCKPISTVGSEQLLLDTHMLKTALLELPSIGSEVKRPAPATYTKVVIKLMTKAEMILKLVMAPLDAVETFTAQFVSLLPECSLAEYRKVLDMKGVRLNKAQLAALDALYRDAARNLHAHQNNNK